MSCIFYHPHTEGEVNYKLTRFAPGIIIPLVIEVHESIYMVLLLL